MLLDDVANFIDNGTTGFTIGTNLFKATLPPGSADTAIGVYEGPGLGPAWTFGSTTPTAEKPRIQVISRSSAFETARNNAETIHKVLDRGVVNSTLAGSSGPRYLTIRAAAQPAFIGQDETDRYKISCNYDVEKERS